MYEYYKRKIVYRKGYKRFPYNTDLLYEKLTKIKGRIIKKKKKKKRVI